MSKKSASIIDEISSLERSLSEKEKVLKLYEKSIDKFLKSLFGIGKKSIDKLIESSAQESTNFEEEICRVYDLNTDADKEDFLRVMCGESSKRFFESHRN